MSVSSSEEDDSSDDLLAPQADLAVTGASKFASALSGLLQNDKEPFQLANEVTKPEKPSRAARKRAKVQRDRFETAALVTLPETDPHRINAERDLRRVATRGVVALFNAIGVHQSGMHQQKKKNNNKQKDVKQLPKDNFLQMLNENVMKPSGSSSRSNSQAKGGGGGWDVLQDDYIENNMEGGLEGGHADQDEDEEEFYGSKKLKIPEPDDDSS